MRQNGHIPDGQFPVVTDPIDDVDLLHKTGCLAEIDLHFARFLSRLAGRSNPALTLAAALVSRAAGNGHICLDLATPLVSLPEAALTPEMLPAFPDASHWAAQLRDCSVVGRPGDYRPLVLEDDRRLYLYRYWEYEKQLIDWINHRCRQPLMRLSGAVTEIRSSFKRLFPETIPKNVVNWQRIAALVAFCKSFSVITGGPGTGKTHTVAKLLALLIEQAGSRVPEILLAAPTGKAAARLAESLQAARPLLACNRQVRERIPVEAGTIHRLLGPITGTPYFRYNRNNPLPADVLVVDEASMIDLPLMSKLTQALQDHTRLILIGDKDQLSSVEAGAVLGDLCSGAEPNGFSTKFIRTARQLTDDPLDDFQVPENRFSCLQDGIIHLEKSYRFSPASGIGALSRAVNRGDASSTLQLLQGREQNGICRREARSPLDLYRGLRPFILRGYRDYPKAVDPAEALRRFNRFKILAAVNQGAWGVDALNRLVKEVLGQAGLIGWAAIETRDYEGRAVLITANDYATGLFNGDIGITVAEGQGEQRRLTVCFPGAGIDPRRLPAGRLPEHTDAYAMTVHKSQGSEFDEVHLVLPPVDLPLLTRELIYTAITRARSSVCIWGSVSVLAAAVARRLQRSSGLRRALWGRGAD